MPCRRHALVHLDEVDFVPRHIFSGERTQHLPRGAPAAHGQNEASARRDRLSGRGCNNFSCSESCRIGIVQNFNFQFRDRFPFKQVTSFLCGSGILPRPNRGWKPLPREQNLFRDRLAPPSRHDPLKRLKASAALTAKLQGDFAARRSTPIHACDSGPQPGPSLRPDFGRPLRPEPPGPPPGWRPWQVPAGCRWP